MRFCLVVVIDFSTSRRCFRETRKVWKFITEKGKEKHKKKRQKKEFVKWKIFRKLPVWSMLRLYIYNRFYLLLIQVLLFNMWCVCRLYCLFTCTIWSMYESLPKRIHNALNTRKLIRFPIDYSLGHLFLFTTVHNCIVCSFI